jgi:hypothetical protein
MKQTKMIEPRVREIAATDSQEKIREPGDPCNKDWWDKGNRRFASAMAAVTKTEQAA